MKGRFRNGRIHIHSDAGNATLVVRDGLASDRCSITFAHAQGSPIAQLRGGQPPTLVAQYGWMASPVKAGLRRPPSAADGLEGARHAADVRHQAIDGKVRLKPTPAPCRLGKFGYPYSRIADPCSPGAGVTTVNQRSVIRCLNAKTA
jgi:hypothetical protein